jgi:hypothetical protein
MDRKELPINYESQDNYFTCWKACIKMILNFEGITEVLPFETSNESKTFADISNILNAQASIQNSIINFSEFSIENNIKFHPIIARYIFGIEDSGHAFLISGFYRDRKGIMHLSIKDPLNSEQYKLKTIKLINKDKLDNGFQDLVDKLIVLNHPNNAEIIYKKNRSRVIPDLVNGEDVLYAKPVIWSYFFERRSDRPEDTLKRARETIIYDIVLKAKNQNENNSRYFRAISTGDRFEFNAILNNKNVFIPFFEYQFNKGGFNYLLDQIAVARQQGMPLIIDYDKKLKSNNLFLDNKGERWIYISKTQKELFNFDGFLKISEIIKNNKYRILFYQNK